MRIEYDFSKLKEAEPKYVRQLKVPVAIWLEPQVIDYFKNLAKTSVLP